MSILINMEMPESCEQCPVCHEYQTLWFVACGCKITMKTREVYCDTRPDCCPLVDVPDKHGRLIDADALFEKAYKAYGMDADETETNFFLDIINNAPTVIPADKEVGNG